MTKIKLDPSTNAVIALKLYKNVENMAELKTKIIAGKVQGCFINPKLIYDPFQIVIAANKAAITETKTTKTLYSEILFNLSISKSISRSLKDFGISEQDTSVLIVTVNADTENDQIFELIRGQEADLEELKCIRDLNLIRKLYNIEKTEEKCYKDLLGSIISRIVTKEFASYGTN